jgi:hypothetical protein
MVRVELYADATDGQEPVRQPLQRREEARASTNACVYRAAVPPSSRPGTSRRVSFPTTDAFVPSTRRPDSLTACASADDE